jgi:hypothetical protein
MYLGVILDYKFDWKAHLENRMRKACTAYLQWRRAVGKTWGLSPKGSGLTIHFRGEAHSFVCFAGMVEESGAEKCSETALSLAADDVFEFKTNVCFISYVNVAKLTFVHKTRCQTGG